VHHADGGLARSAGALNPGEAVRLVFIDGALGAVVDGGGQASAPGSPRRQATPKAGAKQPDRAGQGDLF